MGKMQREYIQSSKGWWWWKGGKQGRKIRKISFLDLFSISFLSDRTSQRASSRSSNRSFQFHKKIFLLSLSSCSCFLKIWVGRGECEESRAVVVTIVEGTRPLYSQVPQVPYKLVGEPNNLFVKVWLGGQIVKWKMAGALYNACGRINRINQIKNATQFVERRRTAALWCIWCITILAHHY